ncbi:MAG: hypothetical protein ACTSO2_19535 [Promethearchaeota archaeon]
MKILFRRIVKLFKEPENIIMMMLVILMIVLCIKLVFLTIILIEG